MSRSTHQPESLGRTVTSGGICRIKIGEASFEAFVVGALDRLGFSEELASMFDEGKEYPMGIEMNGKTLNIKG